MTHKADSSFFEKKRPWSERKDLILGYYLTPYLPKIATQRRPILLVDGFAGPGQFGDGNPGSPLIICRAVEHARRNRLGVPVSVICIEKDASLACKLRERTAGFEGTDVRNADFLDVLPEIERRANSENVFLYLDPFTALGLEWAALDRVFGKLNQGSSVEVLLNFSGAVLARLASLVMRADEAPTSPAEESEPAVVGTGAVVAEDLDRVLGGSWWRQIVQESMTFPEKERRITETYCEQLRTRFAEVCWHHVKERASHKLPKYTLVFASRHPDALELMNDAMNKSLGKFAEEEQPASETLFEVRSEDLVPDVSKLPTLVLDRVTIPISRLALVREVIRAHFGLFSSSQIRRAVGELLHAGKLISSTGKTRINDQVKIWRNVPPSGP